MCICNQIRDEGVFIMKNSDDTQKIKLLWTLAFTLIFSSMNGTMFNVALPAIGVEYSLLPSQSSWMITGYMIIYAIGAVIYGKLSDQYKLYDLLKVGLIVFLIGSVVGFVSTSFGFVLLGRIIQAIGAAVLPAASMIVPTRYFSSKTRGRALGITSAGLSFGVAIGPVVSGFITTAVNWHYLFLISLLPVMTLPLFKRYLTEEVGTSRKTDIVGAALLAGTITAFLLAISTKNIYFGVSGIVLLLLFLWRIVNTQEPFLQPSLFQNKSYTAALLIYAIGAGVGFGLPYLIPQLLVEVNHLSAFNSGLIMFPAAAIAALLARTGGKIADLRGSSFLAYVAALGFFICFCSLSFIAGHSPFLIMSLLIFGYLGHTFFQIAMANIVSRTLPKAQTGVGMGLFMLVNFIASSVSTTLLGSSLNRDRFVWRMNPFQSLPEGVKYSNIFVVLALIVFLVVIVYYFFSRIKHFKYEYKPNKRSSAK